MHPPYGDGSGQDTYDEVVQFGKDRSPGGRWLPRIALACLVLAAIIALVVRGAGHQSRPAARTPPPPAIRVITVGHRLLGVTAGWELFARGPDDLIRVQLAQGKILVTYVPSLESADPNVAFLIGPHEVLIRSTDLVPGYVVPDGAQARPLPGSLADGGPLVPGPARAQAGWVMTGLPGYPALSLISLSGRLSGPTIRFPPGGPQLPATAVSDGRGYVLVDTGSSSAYDAGPGWDRVVPGTVIAVGPAAWLVVTCDARNQRCRNAVVDTSDGARRRLPGPAAGFPYTFQWPPTGVIAPDGSTAAVAESSRLGQLTVHLINLHTGAGRRIKIPLGADLGSPLGADLSDQSMVWSPDSRWLFVAAADGKLVAVDASTGKAERLPVSLPAVTQVAIRT